MLKQRLGSPKKQEQSAPPAALLRVASESTDIDGLSPELVPIVTLLSSQVHRRYHEGIFMLYYDINSDGKPADREWREVYGILTGNQLAYWDAANLAQFRNNPEALLEASTKPNYINFTDSVYNAMRNLPAAKQNLENVVIVLTTLKNRYILQFKSYGDLTTWCSALRLANFEYSSLQGAYTAALLSARGSRLSDIRTILAEKRFDHEDWVLIRYGSGMAWKRCYAVVEPSVTKRKSFTPGRILLYENEHKKKKLLMAVIATASSVTAIYPQSPQLIDHSTMLKLEAYINFKSPLVSPKVSKKSMGDFTATNIFLMPEQHSSVPGFDTLIRFLVPLLDSFGLYGRPKRLKADRVDPESLLFGLPTLPAVHYLEVNDVQQLAQGDFLNWDQNTWNNNIRGLLRGKLERGYEGCGSQRGVLGAIVARQASQGSLNPNSPLTQTRHDMDHQSQRGINGSQMGTVSSHNSSGSFVGNASVGSHQNGGIPGPSSGSPTKPPMLSKLSQEVKPDNNKNVHNLTLDDSKTDHHKSIQLADIYQKYSTIKTPSDQFHTDRNQLLNGSHEKFDEEDLVGMRNLNLGVYPTNDNELFSDADSDSDLSQKIDVRRLGVPGMGMRNSTYSSVQSPTTQFNEFNSQFAETVADNKKRFSGYSDSGSENEEPAPPQHHVKYSQTSTPRVTATYNGDHTSIHSETGRVSDALSPYLEDLPLLPPQTGKPRFITSPNSSQNRIPRYHDKDDKGLYPDKGDRGFTQVYPTNSPPKKGGLANKLTGTLPKKLSGPLPSLPPQELSYPKQYSPYQQAETLQPMVKQRHNQAGPNQAGQAPHQAGQAPHQGSGHVPNAMRQQKYGQAPPQQQSYGYQGAQMGYPQGGYPQGQAGQGFQSQPRPSGGQGPSQQGYPGQRPPQGAPRNQVPPQGAPRPQNQVPPQGAPRPQNQVPPQGAPRNQVPAQRPQHIHIPPQGQPQRPQNQAPPQGYAQGYPQGYPQGRPGQPQQAGFPRLPGFGPTVNQLVGVPSAPGFPRSNGTQSPGQQRSYDQYGYQYQPQPNASGYGRQY